MIGTLSDEHRERLVRALVDDDPHPNDVCPGCGRGIAGWEAYDHHYRSGFEVHDLNQSAECRRRRGGVTPFPFSDSRNEHPAACAWDRDQLTARFWRRLLIWEAIEKGWI